MRDQLLKLGDLARDVARWRAALAVLNDYQYHQNASAFILTAQLALREAEWQLNHYARQMLSRALKPSDYLPETANADR